MARWEKRTENDEWRFSKTVEHHKHSERSGSVLERRTINIENPGSIPVLARRTLGKFWTYTITWEVKVVVDYTGLPRSKA